MRVSPLYVDVIFGPSIVKSEISCIHFSGLCSGSVAAAIASMTVITQQLLMEKTNFTLYYTWAKYNVHI